MQLGTVTEGGKLKKKKPNPPDRETNSADPRLVTSPDVMNMCPLHLVEGWLGGGSRGVVLGKCLECCTGKMLDPAVIGLLGICRPNVSS